MAILAFGRWFVQGGVGFDGYVLMKDYDRFCFQYNIVTGDEKVHFVGEKF